MNPIWIAAIVITLLMIICYAWYVSLIGKRNGAREALSGIDVQLRKRFDLIPNILKIAGRFLQHERELMTQITELRGKAMQTYNPGDADSVSGHLQAAGALQPAMTRLFAVSENYPQLKSDQTMLRAQETYTEVEGHIAAARRAYNATATRLNNSVEIFPGNVIAAMAGVKAMPFYEEKEEEVRQPVDASEFLK
jgi:LemA protein